jgi:hypothetical protein
MSNRNAEAVIRVAERFGRDGRGRDGLRGYMVFLAREHPAQFVTWLNKAVRAGLPKKPARRKRARDGLISHDRQIAIGDALISAAERLGIDGKGRGGIVGYFRSLARARLRQFMRLLSLVLEIQEAEARAAREQQNAHEAMKHAQFEKEISAMSLEEKKAKMRAMMESIKSRATH